MSATEYEQAVVDHGMLDVEGPGAPPRSNGELMFAEPWESRAFGLAVTLHNAGVFEWDAFRERLIARIASWEAQHEPGECWSYYRCWLDALEEVILDGALLDAEDLVTRIESLSYRPPGHDHADADHDRHHD
jgi:nitrile hydratase accessory protein